MGIPARISAVAMIMKDFENQPWLPYPHALQSVAGDAGMTGVRIVS
jgi:hypothetical protein